MTRAEFIAVARALWRLTIEPQRAEWPLDVFVVLALIVLWAVVLAFASVILALRGEWIPPDVFPVAIGSVVGGYLLRLGIDWLRLRRRARRGQR